MSIDVSIGDEVASLLDDESLDIVTGRASRGEGSCQICGGPLDGGRAVAVGAIASRDGRVVRIMLPLRTFKRASIPASAWRCGLRPGGLLPAGVDRSGRGVL